MFLVNLSVSSISESFLTVKGAALFLPRGNGSSTSTASRFSQLRNKHAGKRNIRENKFQQNKINSCWSDLCLYHYYSRRHPAASANHVHSPQARGQHQTGGYTHASSTQSLGCCQGTKRVFPSPGRSTGEHPWGHPLHGGGFNQWSSGHGGERGAWNGFQSER